MLTHHGDYFTIPTTVGKKEKYIIWSVSVPDAALLKPLGVKRALSSVMLMKGLQVVVLC